MNELEFRNNIQNILNDNRSGSTGITNNLMLAIRSYVASGKYSSDTFMNEAVRIYRQFPSMMVLFHFVNELFLQVEAFEKPDENLNGSILLDFLDVYTEKWKNSGLRIGDELLEDYDLKAKQILLHSHSGALINLLERAVEQGQKPACIWQTVGYPAGEGKVQAEKLIKLDVDINMIPESAAGNIADKLDAIFLGADAITKKWFVNKTGSLPLALLAKHHQVPVVVLADSRKQINLEDLPENLKRTLLIESPKPPDELWEDPPQNIRPVNFYFERIPNDLIDHFVSEKGIYTPESMFFRNRFSELFLQKIH